MGTESLGNIVPGELTSCHDFKSHLDRLRAKLPLLAQSSPLSSRLTYPIASLTLLLECLTGALNPKPNSWSLPYLPLSKSPHLHEKNSFLPTACARNLAFFIQSTVWSDPLLCLSPCYHWFSPDHLHLHPGVHYSSLSGLTAFLMALCISFQLLLKQITTYFMALSNTN